MCDSSAREIPLDSSVEKLMKLYLVEWPKHIVIHSTLLTFIQRFKEFPELKERFRVFALSDDWENDGAFLASFVCNDIETCVFFDSLSDVPTESLKNYLRSLDYTNLVTVYSVRNVFRPMLLDLINERDFQIFDDTNAVCYYLPKGDAKKLEMTLPSSTRLTSLSEKNVKRINAAWPHRYDGSEKFISYSIDYHMSAGLFDDAGNLLAWSLRYDNGSIGVLGVDPQHYRKGYGSVMVKAMSRKIADECDSDVTALIQYQNEKSLGMFTKLGFQPVDSHTWFVLTSK